jgi:xylose isomerase
MRSYLILKEKVARFHADTEIQAILKTLDEMNQTSVEGIKAPITYSAKTAAALKSHSFDVGALRTQGYQYERLDQLTTELLLGLR